MSNKTEVTLFVKVSPVTHRRLSVIAAKLGIPKGELYGQALIWASGNKAFKDAIAKIYKN